MDRFHVNLKFETQHVVLCSVNSKAVSVIASLIPDAHDVEKL